MSQQSIPAKLIPFGGTYADLTSANPLPKYKEIVIEIGTPPRIKIGDGVTRYNALPYVTNYVDTAYQGVADASTTPPSLAGSYWFAVTPGTYTHFDGIVVPSDVGLGILSYDGTAWTYEQAITNLSPDFDVVLGNGGVAIDKSAELDNTILNKKSIHRGEDSSYYQATSNTVDEYSGRHEVSRVVDAYIGKFQTIYRHSSTHYIRYRAKTGGTGTPIVYFPNTSGNVPLETDITFQKAFSNSPNISNGYIAFSNTTDSATLVIADNGVDIENDAGIVFSVKNDTAFENPYFLWQNGLNNTVVLPPTTITGTNVIRFQNSSGTIAHLSDIPTQNAGVDVTPGAGFSVISVCKYRKLGVVVHLEMNLLTTTGAHSVITTLPSGHVPMYSMKEIVLLQNVTSGLFENGRLEIDSSGQIQIKTEAGGTVPIDYRVFITKQFLTS